MASKRSPVRATPAKVLPASLGDALPLQGGDTPVPLPWIIAIGASAGGIDALLKFFRETPPDGGCAFVVVMHLAPNRESSLAALIARATVMPVKQVDKDSDVQANHVYVAPPGFDLKMQDGRLAVEKMAARVTKPMAIDRCMMSVAADRRERVIGVVMSGADGDGALGLKAIKSEGGYTFAQTPASAIHPDMPLHAIAAGVVDRQMEVEQMPAAIMQIVRHVDDVEEKPGDELGVDHLKTILDHLNNELGLDFRGYKTPMLHRRIRRRMGLCSIRSELDYLRHLVEVPAEAEALAKDFLIGVTEFFREPETWQILIADFLPRLLQDKEHGESVRIWVAGCATGEEAYSIAMTVLEHPLYSERRLSLQVFATDIDARALDVGRRGLYPEAIHQTVGAERLQRFFSRVDEGYRVVKELRDAVMFAPQNLVNDPPFSHLDLVSCRNLLIYMKPELQRHVLQIFHFALRRDGLLVLGKSETASGDGDLFLPVAQRARIFRRIGPPRLPEPRSNGRPGAAAMTLSGAFNIPSVTVGEYVRLIRESLVDQHITAAILTNRDGQALYFYGALRPFVLPPAGSPSNDLFTMIREELRPKLRAVLLQAAKKGRRAEAVVGSHTDEGDRQPVRLVAMPVGHRQEGLLLVTFERMEPEPTITRGVKEGEAAAMSALEDELRSTKNELRSAISELEATNEELKVANEEAMSVNEELQSSNEELQTSKEELQAINEELTTVNQQLLEKVSELESLTDDLGNLLSSSHIPTLFLDRQFRIKRHTPAAARMFRLIPGDINRPVTDLASFSDLEYLLEDAERVLESLAPIERETRMPDGQEFLRRILPYRTQQDRIEGVVVTFTNITELRRASEDLRRYAAVMRDSNDAVVVLDLEGRILDWNRAAETIYGYAESDVLNGSLQNLLPEEARQDFVTHLERAVRGERLVAIEMQRRRKDGSRFDVSATFSLIMDDKGQAAALALIERDISLRKELETAIHESEHRFRSLANQAPVLIWTGSDDGSMDFVNREFTAFTGLSERSLLRQRWIELLHPDDVDRGKALCQPGGAADSRRELTARVRTADGDYRWVKITSGFHGSGRVVGSMVDVDAQVDAERRMREANRRKDEFLAMLGHELRNPLVPILNAAEVLNQLGGEDSRLRWARDTLVRQVEHVTRLVDDLLDISMITRGSMRLHLEPVELGGVARRACEATSEVMLRKRHHFDSHIPDESLWLEGDAVRLTQIIENLLTNAAKFTDEGGHIELTVQRQGERVLVEVADEGLGIEPDMLSRIFDLFVQDARSVDRSQGGLGIGLALVRHLVELHGGEIRASSGGRGEGSRISLYLPLLPAASIPAPVPAIPSDEHGRGRVLVVDDDVDAGESMVILLGMYGYQVERAVDLPTAVQAARGLLPQVVILDLALPKADGFEIARRLRAMPELGDDVSYISLSGFGQPRDFQRSQQAGFAHHLVKPTSPSELNNLLKGLLENRDEEPG